MCKKLKVYLLLSVFLLQGFVWGQSPSSSKEELAQILKELEEINNQQAELLKKQEQTIIELQTSNEEKQRLLNQQEMTISMLKTLMEEQENSLKKQKVYSILYSVGSGLVGFGLGSITVQLGR